MKAKIIKIYRADKDKKGNDLTTKDGRKYTRLAIKIEQYEDKWISGFENERTKNWDVGSEVDIIIEQNNDFLNFRLQPLAVKYKEFLDLKDRVLILEDRVSGLEGEDIGETDTSEKAGEDEPQDDEVPF